MVEANHSISRHTPLTIAQHVAMATMTRAMQLARGVVKEQLKRQRIVYVQQTSGTSDIHCPPSPSSLARAQSYLRS